MNLNFLAIIIWMIFVVSVISILDHPSSFVVFPIFYDFPPPKKNFFILKGHWHFIKTFISTIFLINVKIEYHEIHAYNCIKY